MQKYRLEWAVSEKGYRLEADAPDDGKRRELSPQRLVRLGADQTRTWPLQDEDALYMQLLDLPDHDGGALTFASRHGFLIGRRAIYQKTGDFFRVRSNFRTLVKWAVAKDWKSIQGWLRKEHNESFPGVGKLGLIFQYEGANVRPTLWHQPVNLENALYVQFLGDIEDASIDEGRIRRCGLPETRLRRGEWGKGRCPRYFKFGTGTKKRKNGRYCSEECLKRSEYLKSNEEQHLIEEKVA